MEYSMCQRMPYSRYRAGAKCARAAAPRRSSWTVLGLRACGGTEGNCPVLLSFVTTKDNGVRLHPVSSPCTLLGHCSRQCAIVERTTGVHKGLASGAGRCAQPRSSESRAWTRRSRTQFRICASLSESSSRNEQLKDAAKGGDLAVLESLLAGKDVQVNLPSESRAGWTALHLAAFYEHPEVVEALLKAGASTEIRNESGNTALQLACLRGNVNIAKLLLDYGADIRAESNDRGTVMDYAVEWGGEEMVDFLYSWAAVHNSV